MKYILLGVLIGFLVFPLSHLIPFPAAAMLCTAAIWYCIVKAIRSE